MDLEGRCKKYTVRLRTKNSLPETLQATQLKILGMKDADGNAISDTESAGDAGKKVFLTNWDSAQCWALPHRQSVRRATTETGMYWISIFKQLNEN